VGLLLSATAFAVKKPAVPPAPAAELVSINTHEHFVLRPDAKGKFGNKELKGWTRFMRCWHTGRKHAMAPRLAALIYETAKHFEFKLITLYDGYRAPSVARQKGNTKSPHKKGIAADFRIQDVDNKTLRDFLYTTFDGVGVGYYPNSTFVHLDVRSKGKAFWTDYSYPNQRQSKSFYAKKTFEQTKEDEAKFEALHSEEEEGGEPPQGDDNPGAPAPKPLDGGTPSP
jgi:uncharacterized protein YcbK (DUF882 family)